MRSLSMLPSRTVRRLMLTATRPMRGTRALLPLGEQTRRLSTAQPPTLPLHPPPWRLRKLLRQGHRRPRQASPLPPPSFRGRRLHGMHNSAALHALSNPSIANPRRNLHPLPLPLRPRRPPLLHLPPRPRPRHNTTNLPLLWKRQSHPPPRPAGRNRPLSKSRHGTTSLVRPSRQSQPPSWKRRSLLSPSRRSFRSPLPHRRPLCRSNFLPRFLRRFRPNLKRRRSRLARRPYRTVRPSSRQQISPSSCLQASAPALRGSACSSEA